MQRPSSIDQVDDARRARAAGRAACADIALPQHAADLAAGRVARVQHAPHAVRAFERQRRLAVGAAIERRAPRPSARARSAGRPRPARAPPARRTGRRRRPCVSAACRLGRVVGADRGGDAALRVAGVALAGSALVRMRTSPAPASSAAARRPAMPLPMMRKSAREVHGGIRSCYPRPILTTDPHAPSNQCQTPYAVPSPSTSARPRRAIPIEIGAGVGRAGSPALLDARRSAGAGASSSRARRSGSCTASASSGVTGEEPILIPDGERYKNVSDGRCASTTR